MVDAETILVLVTGLVGIVSITAVQIKKGLIMGSVWSQVGSGTKKYVERPGKRKLFSMYIGLALIVTVLVALLFTRDLKLIAFFSIMNLIFVWHFLSYFMLLEPKDKIK